MMAIGLVGCSSGGDEPGPKPVDINSPEGKQKQEDAINAAPPERREQIRQMIEFLPSRLRMQRPQILSGTSRWA